MISSFTWGFHKPKPFLGKPDITIEPRTFIVRERIKAKAPEKTEDNRQHCSLLNQNMVKQWLGHH